MEKTSLLEAASENIGTSVVSTLIAVTAGGYLAPLLPVLSVALANNRFKLRVEGALKDIDARLQSVADEVYNLSDPQLKLINETVSAILRCIDEDKLSALKSVATNIIGVKELNAHEAEVISRVIRDISGLEVHFLKTIRRFTEVIVLDGKPPDEDETKLFISPSGSDAVLLSGLVNLGLVISVGSGYGGTANYRIHPIAHTICDLVYGAND